MEHPGNHAYGSGLSDTRAGRKIMEFDGIAIDIMIQGEFLVELRSLPKNGLIRSVMGKAKLGGIIAKQTGQTLTIDDNPIRELSWKQLEKNLFEVTIIAQKSTRVSTYYLQECEDFVVRAFNALVLGGKPNAASRH